MYTMSRANNSRLNYIKPYFIISFYFYLQYIFNKIFNYVNPFKTIYTIKNNKIINCWHRYNIIYWFKYVPLINTIIFKLFSVNSKYIRLEFNNQYYLCENNKKYIYDFFRVIKTVQPKLNNPSCVYAINTNDNSRINLSNYNKYSNAFIYERLIIIYFELAFNNILHKDLKNYKVYITTLTNKGMNTEILDKL